MAYDEDLASRFRATLSGTPSISEKRMMGGICFLINGNMIGGADRTKQDERRFMFRVGKDNEAEALSRPGAKIMQQGGRRMGGFIFVDEAECDDEALQSWAELALSHAGSLPSK